MCWAHWGLGVVIVLAAIVVLVSLYYEVVERDDGLHRGRLRDWEEKAETRNLSGSRLCDGRN